MPRSGRPRAGLKQVSAFFAGMSTAVEVMCAFVDKHRDEYVHGPICKALQIGPSTLYWSYRYFGPFRQCPNQPGTVCPAGRGSAR